MEISFVDISVEDNFTSQESIANSVHSENKD